MTLNNEKYTVQTFTGTGFKAEIEIREALTQIPNDTKR